MKVFLLTLLSFFLMTATFSQNKDLSSGRQDTMKLLCQRWVLTTMSAQGKSANVPASEAMYVTYYTDGKFMDSSARFNVSYGLWSYDNLNGCLYMTDKGDKNKTKVIKITPNELVLEMEYPTVTMTTTYKRAD